MPRQNTTLNVHTVFGVVQDVAITSGFFCKASKPLRQLNKRSFLQDNILQGSGMMSDSLSYLVSLEFYLQAGQMDDKGTLQRNGPILPVRNNR